MGSPWWFADPAIIPQSPAACPATPFVPQKKPA
jgi:hypothetical protein